MLKHYFNLFRNLKSAKPVILSLSLTDPVKGQMSTGDPHPVLNLGFNGWTFRYFLKYLSKHNFEELSFMKSSN